MKTAKQVRRMLEDHTRDRDHWLSELQIEINKGKFANRLHMEICFALANEEIKIIGVLLEVLERDNLPRVEGTHG